MKSKLKIMPASSSSMSSSSGNGGCRDCHNHSVSVCHLCDMGSQNVTTCPIMSCTPIDALPGYQDQQRYPLPPIPRERGRSRVIRGRPLPPPHGHPPTPSNAVQVFCSPVILSTSTPAENPPGIAELFVEFFLSPLWVKNYLVKTTSTSNNLVHQNFK